MNIIVSKKKMNEDYIKKLHIFISMNSGTVKTTSEPCVYLIPINDLFDQSSPIKKFKQNDIIENFNKDSFYIQWVMKQLTTYNCEKQVIMGIIVDKNTIISDVVTKKS